MLLEDWGGGLLQFFGQVAAGLIMLAICVGCAFMFLFGVVLLRRAAYLSRHGVRVEGRVVGTHINPGDSEGAEYRIVEFTDLQGYTRCSTLMIASSDDPPVGRLMELVYDPANPGNVSGASRFQLWLAPAICCGVGGAGVLVVIGVVNEVLSTR